MTSTAATTAPIPPSPGSGVGLPPALPPGFTTPGSTTGGGATTTPAPTTPPATAGTSTSFMPATTAGGPTFQTIPAPGSCTTPPPVPGKDPAQVAPIQQTTGGGAVAGVNGDALAPVLTQLTGVIGKLSSLVGGISGGGPGGKTPEQAPPKDATKGGGGAVAGANGGGAPAPIDPSKCNMDHGTKGGGPTTAPATAPATTTVAGANGAPAADAANAAGQVQGGGGSAASNEAIVAALKGVIEALNALVKALGSQTSGGGPGGKPDPTQKGDLPPAPGAVAGDSGPGKGGKVGGDAGPGQKDPTQAPPKVEPPKVEPPKVGGEQGPGQKDPGQKPPAPNTPPPAATPPVAVPVGQVAGQQGPGQKPQVGGQQGPGQTPEQKPAQQAPATQVAGANGGVQQEPAQVPTQVPTQVGGVQQKPAVAQGNVILDNDDDRWSAKLTAKGGKGENSVELWGDPHVVIKVDGKDEKFDIGYGAGAVTLFDGTKVSWDTYDKGDKNQFILRDFKVDSPGTEFDRGVTTRDRNGDKGDQMNLTTALSDAHLKELATALRTMQGPMSDPLKNGTWVSPAYQKPTQGGGLPVQTAVAGVQQQVVQQTAVAGVQQVDQVAQSA